MDRIEQYRVFVQIAELGNFIQAARLMKLPRATVSSAIQQLEANAGTRLLHRTTRKVSLTNAGTQSLLRARQCPSNTATEYDKPAQIEVLVDCSRTARCGPACRVV